MSQKKVGILSLYYDNFNMGGLLQAYALQQTLDKLGYKSEQICFDFKNKWDNPTIKQKINDTKFGRMLLRIRRWRNQKIYLKRNFNFYRFMKKIPHSKRIYHSDKVFAKLYDIILVGSDQVWGEFLIEDALKSFLLNGTDERTGKYTYAASLGSSKIKKEIESYFVNALPNFKQVSVREKNAQIELDRILPAVQVRVDLDPTLLLKAEEWKKLCKKPYMEEKYIYCYFLGGERKYRDETKKVAKKYDLPIATLPYIFDNKTWNEYDDDFGDYRDFYSGPAGFISGIRDAEVVITDSFHAAVFSTLFHKKFYVLSRVNDYAACTDTRMLNFLAEFGLEERFVSIEQLSEVDLLKEIDFTMFEEKIPALRKQSIGYLSELN